MLRIRKSKILGLCLLGLTLAVIAYQMKPANAYPSNRNLRVQIWVKLLQAVDPWPCDAHAEIYCNLQLDWMTARIPGWPGWVSVAKGQDKYIGEQTFSGLYILLGKLKVQIQDYDFPFSSKLLYQGFVNVPESSTQFKVGNSKVAVTVRITWVK